ncbi:MAG: metalloregulator ArsR/SmtB family transcription factor [Candidatus Omnitrophica bacterium]|nr:metalloregulator ArsR/SmtB family transcription factor [Candidatus Omnitrophota bacterium]
MAKVKNILSKKQLETIANGLQGISHPIRIGIVYLLLQEELSVNELSQSLEISQSVTSQHLSKLKESDILDFRKESNRVYYYIKNPNYKNLLKLIFKFYDELKKPAQKS